VAAGAVKAVVNIARTGTLPGRDSAAAGLAEMSAADSKPTITALRKEKVAFVDSNPPNDTRVCKSCFGLNAARCRNNQR